MADIARGTALFQFGELVASLGGDGAALMREHRIDPDAAGDYERLISYPAVTAVIGAAAQELDCPDFGMRLARRQGVEILGPIAVIIRHSATVADALEGVARYLHNCAPADVMELRRGPRSAALTLEITVRQLAHRDQMVEKNLGTTMSGLRLMLGDDFVPLRVTMQHRRISAPEKYRELFGCPVEFGCEVNAVHLPTHALRREIRGRDAAALTLAEKYLADGRPDRALADHVREMIQRLLAVHQATLRAVAEAMVLHPRVLQRRLAEAGTSFEDILDDVRRTMAWELAATGLQASQIATMLGYSEQSSYARSCRRWYGESPRQLAARRRSATASA